MADMMVCLCLFPLGPLPSLFPTMLPSECNNHLTSVSISHRDEPFSNPAKRGKNLWKSTERLLGRERERGEKSPIRYLLSAGVRLPPKLQSRKDIFKLLISDKDFSLCFLFIYLLIYCPLFHPGSGKFPFDFKTKAAPACFGVCYCGNNDHNDMEIDTNSRKSLQEMLSHPFHPYPHPQPHLQLTTVSVSLSSLIVSTAVLFSPPHAPTPRLLLVSFTGLCKGCGAIRISDDGGDLRVVVVVVEGWGGSTL